MTLKEANKLEEGTQLNTPDGIGTFSHSETSEQFELMCIVIFESNNLPKSMPNGLQEVIKTNEQLNGGIMYPYNLVEKEKVLFVRHSRV